MSKRKVMAGGYEESSDDFQPELGESPPRASKRPLPAPYAPPRLTAASKSGLGTFQLPGTIGLARLPLPASRHASLPPNRNLSLPGSRAASLSASSSRRSTPVVESVRSTGNTPKLGELDLGPDLARGGLDDASKPNIEPVSTSHKANGRRSTLLLERQINELTESFEKYKDASETRYKSSEGHLTRILDAINHLDPASLGLLTSRAPTPFLTTSLNQVKPTFSNPIATPELIAVVSKVVSEARSRVGKKKGGADDNSCKEHARNTFYRMLGITVASDIRPYFEDEYGEPDTLPTQFTDPDTKYCRPYPHWKTPLIKQTAWVPTYILRFKTTIPNDLSELSTMLRSLSDEQILILLNDGPFKSACAAWRNAKKTDLEIEAMRSSARRYQRCDRKAIVRAMHIRLIPSLQGSEWEYLSQPGYMSQDESDEEGKLVTMRPTHRARWETNLFEAIQVAEREKAKARPGLCPRIQPSRIQLVRRSIPHLERGTGSGKATIRIALCSFSKSWREANPDEIQKNAHLLNMKEVVKPDINDFLAKYPMPEVDSGESVKDEPKLDEASDSELWAFGTQVEGQLGEGEYGVDFGMSVSGDGAEGRVAEEDGLILGMQAGSQGHGLTGLPLTQGLEVPVGGSSVGHKAHIVIDPLLLCEGESDSNNYLGAKVSPTFSTSQGALGISGSVLGSHMPPPPPLDHNLSAAEAEEIDSAETPAKGKAKKGKRATGVEGNASTGEVAASQGPKRRGRPPGSKNKPK
ncbi:hypothetical protein BDV93DRAFT_560861 [Ceratobasidium sp. AG-I]|nr:hypothetical protein BDV93DRAFT_560861 [Ceratobasidium sp. AG-I]